MQAILRHASIEPEVLVKVSAEVRWFWKTSAPAGLEQWFKSPELHGGLGPGGGTLPRTDLYRRSSQTDLGIKLRGNKGYEVKGLVAELAPLTDGPFAGAVELWSKWDADGLRFDALELVPTTKLRWIRKLDTDGAQPGEVEIGEDERPRDATKVPVTGCQVELTRVFVGKEAWWSFSFEAFGTVATVEGSLRAAAALMATREPPPLKDGILASYPAWLKGLE